MSGALTAISALYSGLSHIAAVWNDIAFAAPGNGTNNTVTLLFTGAARTLQLNFLTAAGTMSYSKNGAAFVGIIDGGTLSVSSGDTLAWKYTNAASELFTSTVTDNTLGEVIDTFQCSS
jgi:hypothetical protein